MERLCREHLQIVHFPGDLWFGNSIKKLPNSSMCTGAHFLGGADSNDVALVNQHHAIGNQECARQFVRDDDDSHAKCALEFENQLINTGRDDRVEPR